MEQSRLRTFESQCVQEEPPACQTMCPLHVDVRGIARNMREGKLGDARKLLDRTMPLSCLLGLLCSGACMEHCTRAIIDAPVNMPLIERACILATRSSKPMPLPANGKKIAVLGGGISSLVAAFELGKKGYTVSLLLSTLGGIVQRMAESPLTEEAIPDAEAQLKALRVQFIMPSSWEPQLLDQLMAEYDGIYLGVDDYETAAVDWSLEKTPEGGYGLDALTLGTSNDRIFSGGADTRDGTSVFTMQQAPDYQYIAPLIIRWAADGKRGAGSLDRMLQGVSPAVAREKDGAYQSSLYTPVSDRVAEPQIVPNDIMKPQPDEARAEAERCLLCECMACVYECPFLQHYKGYPKKYARAMYNNLAVVHGNRIANKMINSCAQCGLCAALCPYEADLGAFSAEIRKEMVRTHVMPVSAHEFALEDMAYSCAPDISFWRHAPGYTASAFMFFPGCQLPASLPSHTSAVYAYLTQQLQGGVGFYYGCCGIPAEWAGQDHLVQVMRQKVTEVWHAAGKPELIVACSSCMKFFRNHIPAIPVRSLWEILAELPLPDSATASTINYAVHDPCTSRHDMHMQAAVRQLLQQIHQRYDEPAFSQNTTRCCGFGGLAAAAHPEVGDAFSTVRAADSDLPMVTYCSMCRDRLRQAGKDAIHVLSLLFPGEIPADQAMTAPALGVSARQQARRQFRDTMLTTVWNEPSAQTVDETPVLTMTDEVAAVLEARRVLVSDIRLVVAYAKTHATQLYNPSTKHYLASYCPRHVTFWVEYSDNTDGSIHIYDAYYHRMMVPGLPRNDAPSLLDRLQTSAVTST